MIFPEGLLDSKSKLCQLADNIETEKFWSYSHPEFESLSGDSLTINCLRVGSKKAKRTMMVTTGVHGLEADAANAGLLNWLLEDADSFRQPPKDMALLVIQNLNPWGYDRVCRNTENNIDLNRNFHRDFDRVKEYHNPIYEKIHPIVCPENMDDLKDPEILKIFESIGSEVGQSALTDAIMKGQYSHPEGIEFGGYQPEWSHQILKQVLQEELSEAEIVSFIDLHTGLGAFGETFCVATYDPASEPYQWLVTFFGKAAIAEVAKGFEGGKVPEYKGLMTQFIDDELAEMGVKSAGLVLEIGTFDNFTVFEAMKEERWLRFNGKSLAPEKQLAFRRKIRDQFCPLDSQWRSQCIKGYLDKLRKMWNGLSAIS